MAGRSPALAKSLLRNEQLIGVKEGLQIEEESQNFEEHRGELVGRNRSLALVSPKAWLMRSWSDQSQTLVTWCDDQERGVLSKAFQLGRVRKSDPADLRQPPLDVSLGTIYPLDHTYAGYSVQLKPQGDDQTLLVWTNPANPQDEGRILIDTARNVVLRTEHFQNGKITSTTTASDFVQVAGVWWAGRVESINADKKRMGLTTRKFTALEAGGFDQLWKQEMAGRDQVQLLSMPLPSLDQAKRALAEGKTKFEDHMVLMVHFWMSQQWDRVLEHLDKAEKLAAGKPGLRWFRSSILNQARRREEVKTALPRRSGQACQERTRHQRHHLLDQPSRRSVKRHLRSQRNDVVPRRAAARLRESAGPSSRRERI